MGILYPEHIRPGGHPLDDYATQLASRRRSRSYDSRSHQRPRSHKVRSASYRSHVDSHRSLDDAAPENSDLTLVTDEDRDAHPQRPRPTRNHRSASSAAASSGEEPSREERRHRREEREWKRQERARKRREKEMKASDNAAPSGDRSKADLRTSHKEHDGSGGQTSLDDRHWTGDKSGEMADLARQHSRGAHRAAAFADAIANKGIPNELLTDEGSYTPDAQTPSDVMEDTTRRTRGLESQESSQRESERSRYAWPWARSSDSERNGWHSRGDAEYGHVHSTGLNEKVLSELRRSRRPTRESSNLDELEYFKYGRAPSQERPSRRCCCSGWSMRKKRIVLGLSTLSVVIMIVLIAVAVALTRSRYDYTPSSAQVTNAAAFTNGGATHNDSNDVADGVGEGQDEYIYYSGNASNFPPSAKWVSFEDMWNNNLNGVKHSCGWLDYGENNTPQQINDIYTAIQSRANASLVDHRFILAIVLQESNGCVHAGETTSSGGVTNPGLMQSHDGHSYSSRYSALSIMAMVQDGTQGTKSGDGLVQYLNAYGNLYEAARGYNSGYIPSNGNLSEAAGATACYVSDVANRLTGWVTATSTCPSSS